MALSLAASPALATRWTVEIGGGGDFTTIQAAIDQQAIEFRDTILVMPGDYAETMVLPPTLQPGYIVSAGGASVTSAHSLSAPTGYGNYEQTRVEGFTFTQAVTASGTASSCFLSQCVFLGIVDVDGYLGPANFRDCDFYGRTRFNGFRTVAAPSHVFQHLRFHGTTLEVGTGAAGGVGFQNCTFDGPADTLVSAWGDFDPIYFRDCRFTNARDGAVTGYSSAMKFSFTRCAFTDLSGTAIQMDPEPGHYHPGTGGDIWISDSRFERCGTAVWWGFRGRGGTYSVTLNRDTILASRREGVVLISTYSEDIVETIVDGSGGHGVAFLQDVAQEHWWHTPRVVRSAFTNNAGDGVLVANVSVPDIFLSRQTTITDCLFAGNGGAGLRLTGTRWDVRNCVSYANGAEGFAGDATVDWGARQFASNTSALNRGDGFLLTGSVPPGDSLQFMSHNLSVMNAGAGFRVPQFAFDTFAFNDAWGNYLGQYVGAWGSLDSNLTVNPRFCDLGAGDLGLEQGSPCGPGGLYGLIGALPESCPNTLAAEPTAGVGLEFIVRPNVARGSVEFVPPASGGEGEVALFDLAGRVVWRAALGPAIGAIRWRGQGDAGRVRAGLYWARFTRGDERTTQRLVWLE